MNYYGGDLGSYLGAKKRAKEEREYYEDLIYKLVKGIKLSENEQKEVDNIIKEKENH